MKPLPAPTSHLRLLIAALLTLAAALFASGAWTGSVWLLGLGVWAVIGAFLLIVVFSP